MDPFSRRNMLSFSAAGAVATVASVAHAATFGNPDSPAEGAINGNASAVRDPGPRNPTLASQFPDPNNPPATDVGELPQFWASFNNVHKRMQAGGWARQVTRKDFAISKAFSGVNMRLGAGGIREMHWHLASEWAYMTNGRCRITVLDQKGRAYVQDVEEGDLWFFPAGMPHSLQGIGDDGCEFLIAFDDGDASEFNTLLVTDWLAHTPPDILATNFGVPAESFKNIPLDDLWIFQGKEPGLLSDDQKQVSSGGEPPFPFTFKLGGSTPVKANKGGSIQVADSHNFKISDTTAAALITLKPGAMREMHWHPNADEWQYWIKGEGRMGVFQAGPSVQTQDFKAGDVGYVPRNQGHWVQNTGTTDLVFLALFKTAEYQEISLSQWLARTPWPLVAQHFNIDPSLVGKFHADAPGILPA
jgi:oxalate decarboxylase